MSSYALRVGVRSAEVDIAGIVLLGEQVGKMSRHTCKAELATNELSQATSHPEAAAPRSRYEVSSRKYRWSHTTYYGLAPTIARRPTNPG